MAMFRGRVTDVSGAIVSGAEVTLANTGTQIVHSTRTNQAGDYAFTAVDPEHIRSRSQRRISRESSTRESLSILNRRRTVDESLAVGTVGETV